MVATIGAFLSVSLEPGTTKNQAGRVCFRSPTACDRWYRLCGRSMRHSRSAASSVDRCFTGTGSRSRASVALGRAPARTQGCPAGYPRPQAVSRPQHGAGRLVAQCGDAVDRPLDGSRHRRYAITSEADLREGVDRLHDRGNDRGAGKSSRQTCRRPARTCGRRGACYRRRGRGRSAATLSIHWR